MIDRAVEVIPLSCRLASQADTVLISVNPKAGRTSPLRRAELLRDALVRRGFNVELSTDLDSVSQTAVALTRNSRLRALVGVGGDGTAAELVNRTLPETPVTLLPAGTANLLAKQFKLPFGPENMAAMIEHGSTLKLDVGRAGNRIFLVVFTAGIDADIVRQVHARREENYQKLLKRGAHISYCSYIKPIIRSLASYRYPEIDILASSLACLPEELQAADESQVTRHVCRWPFICNLPRYGWGVHFARGCYGNDGMLNYCFFRRGGMISSIMNAVFAQFGGLHRLLPNSSLGMAKTFLVSSHDKVPYQLDGDFAGWLPVSVQIIPRRFHAVVPEQVAAKSPYAIHNDHA